MRLRIPPDGLRLTWPTGNDRAASVLAGLAGVVVAAVLLGWALDIPALRSFGIEDRPMWPLTTLGFASLSAGLLLLYQGHRRLSQALFAAPLALAAFSFGATVFGDLGIGSYFFGELIASYGRGFQGLPSSSAVASFLLLGLAGLRAAGSKPQAGPVVGALATGAFILGVAATLLIVSASGEDPAFRLFASSLPAGLATMLLSASCLASSTDFALFRLLTQNRDRQFVRFLVPAAVLLPALPSLLGAWLTQAQGETSVTGEMVVVLCNAMIVTGLVYWAAVRIGAGQAALVETMLALESATVVLTTPEGRITHWSQGCERLYGWTAAEAIGQDKYALLRSRCQQWWSSGPPRLSPEPVVELIELHRDGHEIAVLESVRRIESPGREPVVVLTISDISQSVAAMAALKASEERLAMATAAHQVGVFEWNVASGRIEWSPGTEQRLGLEPGTITDFDSWRLRVEPEDVEGILTSIAQAVAERADTFSFRYRFLRPNGSVRAVEGSSRAFYDDAGNLLRTVGVMLDTTERDEREAALRAREVQLRSVLETVPDAIVVIDDQGTIRQFSSAAEALWGYPAEAVLGQSFTMLVPADERSRYSRALDHYLRSGQRSGIGQSAPAAGETADGRRFPMELRAGIARVEEQVLFTIFCRDVTERLVAEERMSELNAELTHVSRQSAMSGLAADLAHELNQPLSAIANFLAAARTLIERGDELDRVSEMLRMSEEQTLRAGQIIRRMRDFTERRGVEMRSESVEETVRDAIDLVLIGTGQFHIRVNYDFNPDAKVMFADRIQIQQVIVNLVRNAVDALRGSPPNMREIRVVTRKSRGNMVEIEIADTGTGIAESVLEKLFSRFATTKDQGGGMGIGLSISRRIIEAHGGTLHAENRPEGGAVFRFSLPATEEDFR